MKIKIRQSTHQTEMNNIYESEEFSLLNDHSMHPGGLRLTDRAIRLAGLHKGMKVADIGCGAGTTAAYLTWKYGLLMTGLDISGPLICIGLSKNPGLNLIHRDGKKLPFESQSLDAALFECSLSVMGFSERLVDECYSALSSKGKLIISDIFSRQEAQNSSLPLFTWLESRLAEAGFNIDVSEDHTPALITYAAELSEKFGGACDASWFICNRFAGGFKISDHCYRLIIARKVER
ncbi:MAG: methyltransferase domain-containing protein [Desulfatiglans sp.]|nr:methyltransferase domain-containing protein [Desulfatiglans sp.]